MAGSDADKLQFPIIGNDQRQDNNRTTSDIFTTYESVDTSSLKFISTTPITSTPSLSSSSAKCSKIHFPSNDSGEIHPRKRRQDWCKWPICIQYRTTGYCPAYNPNATSLSSQMCNAAHIGPNDQVPMSPDGQVRVCFDSMGLVNLTCNRSDCFFYHPPKTIRDQIVAKRHAQYLREKVIRDASKSRKSTGLLTFEDNAKTLPSFDCNTKLKYVSHGQSVMTSTTGLNPFNLLTTSQPSSRTVDLISASTMNKDNLQALSQGCNMDPLWLTHVSHHQQPQDQHHQHLAQLHQQTNLKSLIQGCTSNAAAPYLMLNSNISPCLSNIILNSASFIQPPSLNPNILLPNSCPLFSNPSIKSHCPDINLLSTQNQTDNEWLYNMLSMNLGPLTQPMYSSNLITPWSKLLDSLLLSNPLLLSNVSQNTGIPINSQVNCLSTQLIDPLLPFSYLPSISYPLITNSINYQSVTLPAENRGTDSLNTMPLSTTLSSDINIPSNGFSESLHSSSITLTSTAQSMNPEILFQKSQLSSQTDYVNTTTSTIIVSSSTV
ncbi:unnamed protein product [Heterobilharzia americana]|nr:unnamed protein product [Heterobilharzia americana]